MEYNVLGKTGLNISRLGFGGIPIQRIEGKEVRPLMQRLLDHGVNYIDTARGYTVSEVYLGQALEGIRDKFILATKSMSRDKEHMAQDIETSLSNLHTDYIDLYQVHNPNMQQFQQVLAPGGALEALKAAKAAGKIGHIGVTAHSLEVFAAALEQDWVETIMFPYNIVETQGEALMEKCREKQIGVVVMKPLAGGALEDATLAMRFVNQNPAVSVVIPGMATLEEIEQNAQAMQMQEPLTPEEQEKIQHIRDTLGHQFCRRCNYCAPCTVGIQIPNVFLMEGYLTRYGLEGWARTRYDAMEKKASDCVECGVCETRCPYQLPIREMLKKAAASFGV